MTGGGYEPGIVTTLRVYVRRGAPASLLLRIAGGPRWWRELNDRWNLDGQGPGPAVPVLRDGVLNLSTAERRIALGQIADECAQAGRSLPTLIDLAAHFGVSRHTISADLGRLRGTGCPVALPEAAE